VFCAIVMSRILYALPAWGGFLTYELTAKIDSFLRKAVRWGFSSHYKCLTDYCVHLFRKMTSNSEHCIHQLLPSTKLLPMKLRDSYPSVIITCTSILLFSEICLFLLIEWTYGDIVFLVLISPLMLCYAFNLLMAFDRLLLKGLLTYLFELIEHFDFMR